MDSEREGKSWWKTGGEEEEEEEVRLNFQAVFFRENGKKRDPEGSRPITGRELCAAIGRTRVRFEIKRINRKSSWK